MQMYNRTPKPARSLLGRAIVPAMLVLSAALTVPAYAQGAYESPPSPNSNQSMPESPNSAPPTARTLPRGSTGIEQMGTIATTRVQPAPQAPAPRTPAQPTR